jgi:hypothetical protein
MRPLGYERTGRSLPRYARSHTNRSTAFHRPTCLARSHLFASVAPRSVPKSVPNMANRSLSGPRRLQTSGGRFKTPTAGPDASDTPLQSAKIRTVSVDDFKSPRSRFSRCEECEPATFRFSGGFGREPIPFVLFRALRTGRIGPLRADVPKVWPDVGRMDPSRSEMPARHSNKSRGATLRGGSADPPGLKNLRQEPCRGSADTRREAPDLSDARDIPKAPEIITCALHPQYTNMRTLPTLEFAAVENLCPATASHRRNATPARTLRTRTLRRGLSSA